MRRFAMIIAGAIALLQCQIFAFPNSGNEPMWGVKAMLDVNIPGKWKVNGEHMKMYRRGLGGSLGAVCNLNLTDNIFLEPGAFLFYDTYSSSGFVIGDGDVQNKTEPSVYKIGMRVPILIGYTFDIADGFSLRLYTGPELSYSFGGGYRIKNSEKDLLDGVSLFGSNGNKGEMRRVELGWKGGIGFPFDSWVISLEATVGLTDVINGPISMKENRINFGVTRYF